MPRYVDISESEEGIDIQATINELKKLRDESQGIQVESNAFLTELGFRV